MHRRPDPCLHWQCCPVRLLSDVSGRCVRKHLPPRDVQQIHGGAEWSGGAGRRGRRECGCGGRGARVTGYRSIVAEGWRGGWQPPLTAGGRWRAPVGSSGGAGGGGVGGAGGGGAWRPAPAWVEVKKLENYSLFIGCDVRSPAFSCASFGRWSGRSNCLYYGYYHPPLVFNGLGDDADAVWNPDNDDYLEFKRNWYTQLQVFWVYPSMLYR